MKKKASRKPRSARLLDRVIRDMGGVTALAHYCGVSESSIRYWQKPGYGPSAPAAKLISVQFPTISPEHLVKPNER